MAQEREEYHASHEKEEKEPIKSDDDLALEIEKQKAKLDEMVNRVKNMDSEEVKAKIEAKVAEIKKELDELDKEKVLEIAKTKAKEIQDKATELVDYAVEKGTPILERTANSIREKALIVTKDVVTKLEKAEPTKATPIEEVEKAPKKAKESK